MKYTKLINEMTLEEKASLLSGKDFWSTRDIGRLEIPSMSMADGPHGLRKQAENGDHLGLVEGVMSTCFPTSATIANSWDVSLGERIGKALGTEAAFHKVNVVLGPGLNIKRNPLCGRNFEYFSEDPYLSGKMAAAYISGIQANGVSACPKHFAANNQEFLRMTNDSIIDERTYNEIYLTGFEIAVKEGKPSSIMSAYNKINGTYANEHKELLRTILVEQWGFDGIVISDWGGGNDHVEAVNAGAHIEMPTTGNDTTYQLIQAVNSGTLKEAIIDERVDEFLKILYKTVLNQSITVDYEENHSIAREAAEASIVLLKNNSVLPLLDETTVAIIGDFADKPRYQGAGSSMVNPYKVESTLEEVKGYNLDVKGYAKGYNRIGKPDKQALNEAVKLAQNVDVALIYVGLDEVSEVEGHDRVHMSIAQNQVEVIKEVAKVAKKVVAVISCGSAIEMPWEKYCDGIVHGYLSGQAGASAVLNVLTAKTNPSGKLSESYPHHYSDCPSETYYPGTERTSEYREGLYVGYRYYDTAKVDVLYPFGYGLSYTTFEYSDMKITADGVSVKVTNTGKLAGAEVVQMYVSKSSNTVYRPEKELKGFSKVFLKPSETVEVSISFDAYSFRVYNINEHRFVTEKGSYTILIGSSSRNIEIKGNLEVDGEVLKGKRAKVPEKYLIADVKEVTQEEFEQLYGDRLPSSKWDKEKVLSLNDSLSQMIYAKSFLARFAINVLNRLRIRSVKKGKPDLNLFFLSSMPFRAIAKMSGGVFSMEMTEDLLTIVNGHFFKGIARLVKSYRKYRKRGLQ